MSETAIEAQDDNSYRISGELNMQTVPQLLERVAPILQRHSGPVSFDLQGVTRSDSAGLALLVEWMQVASRQQASLSFKNLPTQLHDIARVSGLDSVLPLS